MNVIVRSVEEHYENYEKKMDTIEIKLSMAFNIQAFGTRTLDQDVGRTRSSLHKLFSNKKMRLKRVEI